MALRFFRSVLLIMCCAFAHAPVRAQVDTDSLFHIWKNTAAPDTARLTALNKYISVRFLNTDPDSTLYYGFLLYDSAAAKDLKKHMAAAMVLQGRAYIKRNELSMAMERFRSAFAVYDGLGDLKGSAAVLNNIALTESDLGDVSHAIEHMTRSLRLSEELKDSSMMARTLGNIGTFYAGQGDTANAMDYYKRRLVIAERLGQKDILAEVVMNMGHILGAGRQFDRALACYERGLALSREINYPRNELKCLQGLSYLRFHQGDLAGSLAFDLAAAEIARKIGDRSAEAETYAAIASDHQAMGDLRQALAYAQKAMVLAREGGNAHSIREAAVMLYDVRKALGDADGALAMYELYITMRDSIANEESKQALMGQKFQYEYERKEALLTAEQHAKDAVAAEELRRRNLERNAFMGGVVLALLLAGSLALLYRNSRRNGRSLAEKNRLILDAQAQLVQSERAREANEVRIRIARDVHDQLGSDLTKLVLLSTEAKEIAHTGTNGLNDIANNIERIAGEANRSLGDIVWAIDPHHDSLAGLTERVRAHCERMLKWSKVQHTVDCVHEGPDRSLDPATKRDIYLILREALNNAIKYAGARHIQVAFTTGPSSVRLVVTDDGVGFQETGMARGNGLANMRLRAERIGARLVLDGNAGTTVQLYLDLTA